MLARKQRLTSEKDYDALFKKGRSWNGKGVGMKAARNSVGKTRIGFVVSTKVAKRSVVRNQIKRRMRDIARKHAAVMLSGLDIAFIARAEAAKMDHAAIEAAMLDLLRRAGVIAPLPR